MHALRLRGSCTGHRADRGGPLRSAAGGEGKYCLGGNGVMKAKGKHDDEGNVVQKRVRARRKLTLHFLQKTKKKVEELLLLHQVTD